MLYLFQSYEKISTTILYKEPGVFQELLELYCNLVGVRWLMYIWDIAELVKHGEIMQTFGGSSWSILEFGLVVLIQVVEVVLYRIGLDRAWVDLSAK